MNKKTKELCVIALMAVILTISGSLKLPSFILGAEFQLSAPLAVAICVNFGFKRYFTAGLISSLMTFCLGTHTVINIGVALSFRLVVGLIIHLTKAKKGSIILAGPMGSLISRIGLSILVGKAFGPLLLSAMPGMIFTALMSLPLTKMMKKIMCRELGYGYDL